jgi:hypothetical protein
MPGPATAPIHRPVRPPAITSGGALAGTVTQAPTIPATTLPAIGALMTGGPTALTVFQDKPLTSEATGGQASVTDEPSVSNNGRDVFYTGNFYDALSTDGGQTFTNLDPYTAFPSVFGGFCCDQRTLYVPSQNLTAWALLYGPNAQNENEVRLAVANGQSGLEQNQWTYWDFLSTDPTLDLPSGLSFDYPQLAVSANDLYLVVNELDSRGAIFAAVVYRCPLASLTAPNGDQPDLICTNFDQSGSLNGTSEDTFTPVTGAGTTMYWANHLSNSTLQVFSWPENVDYPGVSSTAVAHSAFPDASPYLCPSPDGTNMCFSDDWTIKGGWLNGTTLGFLWDASQGSGALGDFPYPYVHVVEINTTTMQKIDEPIIWNPTTAWTYPGVALDGEGGLGVSLAYGGGSNYPGSAIMVRDVVSPNAWQTMNLAMSTNGPPGPPGGGSLAEGRWGDFLSVQPASGNGNTWVATSYVLDGSCGDNWGACVAVQPSFLWFGRACNNPTGSLAHAVLPQAGARIGTTTHVIFLPQVLNNVSVPC